MPIINMVYKKKKWWKPWANTVAYYPLEWDTLDYSWNNRNWTNSNVTFSNWVAYFNGSNAMVTIAHDSWNKIQNNMTICAWFKSEDLNGTVVWKFQSNPTSTQNMYYRMWLIDWKAYWWFCNWSDWNIYPSYGDRVYVNIDEWHLLTLTNNWTTKTLYVDKIQAAQSTAGNTATNSNIPLTIWNMTYYNIQSRFKWNIKSVILEDKTWSLADISDYYDNNKPN